ncbi:MAG: DUF111 family protein [Eubacterium sp.]|nr:DUF111 family protein [Eubacterium sp.]
MKDIIIKLESNIDDSTGEMLGYVMDLLLKAGACDVYYTPIYMKKNRPAWQLNVLCKEENIAALEEIIILNTTTIGIRRCVMQRTICDREIQDVTTPYGMAKVKVCLFHEHLRIYPEYESVIAICQKENLSYSEVYQMIVNTYKKILQP